MQESGDIAKFTTPPSQLLPSCGKVGGGPKLGDFVVSWDGSGKLGHPPDRLIAGVNGDPTPSRRVERKR
jgi:hypothetical protein